MNAAAVALVVIIAIVIGAYVYSTRKKDAPQTKSGGGTGEETGGEGGP